MDRCHHTQHLQSERGAPGPNHIQNSKWRKMRIKKNQRYRVGRGGYRSATLNSFSFYDLQLQPYPTPHTFFFLSSLFLTLCFLIFTHRSLDSPTLNTTLFLFSLASFCRLSSPCSSYPSSTLTKMIHPNQMDLFGGRHAHPLWLIFPHNFSTCVVLVGPATECLAIGCAKSTMWPVLHPATVWVGAIQSAREIYIVKNHVNLLCEFGKL